MIKTKQEPKSIYNMWSSLDTEGWVLGDQWVPAGWRVKHHQEICDYKYLTREMKVLSSSEQARQIIKESADYDEENKKNSEEWLKELEKLSRQFPGRRMDLYLAPGSCPPTLTTR